MLYEGKYARRIEHRKGKNIFRVSWEIAEKVAPRCGSGLTVNETRLWAPAKASPNSAAFPWLHEQHDQVDLILVNLGNAIRLCSGPK